MNQRAANLYKKVDLESAPKDQILDRLLERCLADLGGARQAIVDGRIELKANLLRHAQAIVQELQASLDHTRAPELCANLDRLYSFASEKITIANMTMKTSAIDDAAQVIKNVADSFREARGLR